MIQLQRDLRILHKNKYELDADELAILQRHFGIVIGTPETYEQIAETKGITKQRVEQLVRRALTKLNLKNMVWKPEKLEKIYGPSEWDIKYFREQPFMGFGSMMNSYGLINKGKGMSVDEFTKNAKKIFELAIRMASKTYASSVSMAKKVAEQFEEEWNTATNDTADDYSETDTQI